ncbi:hypothetical protein BST61_g8604 [Cercospora zeina]
MWHVVPRHEVTRDIPGGCTYDEFDLTKAVGAIDQSGTRLNGHGNLTSGQAETRLGFLILSPHHEDVARPKLMCGIHLAKMSQHIVNKRVPSDKGLARG